MRRLRGQDTKDIRRYREVRRHMKQLWEERVAEKLRDKEKAGHYERSKRVRT